jgi:hypothetical protein
MNITAASSKQRMAGAGRDPVGHQAEKAGEAQIADDDHHAEQQCDCIEVDRAQCLVERQHAKADHQAGAQ